MKKLGAPVKCPVCGGSNPSGFHDPDRCRWCGKYKVDYSEVLAKIKELEQNMKPLDPEYSKVVDDHRGYANGTNKLD